MNYPTPKFERKIIYPEDIAKKLSEIKAIKPVFSMPYIMCSQTRMQ